MSSRGGTATATADEGVVITPVDVDVDRCTASGSDGDGATAIAAASSVAAATNVIKHSNSLSPLGDASGVAILLGNHAEFGLAERCWYVEYCPPKYVIDMCRLAKLAPLYHEETNTIHFYI